MCTDDFLLHTTTTALSSSSSDDWITSNITDTIHGYRSSLWAVQVATYTRAVFDYLPTNEPTNDLCIVVSSEYSLLAIIVRVSPT